MTLLQALDRLHSLLEGDTETPLTGDDYELRVALLNDAVEEWAQQSDVKWQELYAIDTTHTANGVLTSFALPEDFDSMNGAISLYDTVHDAFTPIGTTSVARSGQYTDRGDLTAWITGGNLVFNVAPLSGAVIHIPYYRKATPLTDNADVLPMSKPRYAIYYALARLVEQSGDFTRYNTNMQKAEEILSQMKIDNQNLGEGVPNQVYSLTPGFGV